MNQIIAALMLISTTVILPGLACAWVVQRAFRRSPDDHHSTLFHLRTGVVGGLVFIMLALSGFYAGTIATILLSCTLNPDPNCEYVF